MFTNELTKALQLKYPIIQAPMAGGITTTELVAAASNNGALGMVGAGYMSSSKLREQIVELKQVTSNPFGVNLFVIPEFSVSDEEIDQANLQLEAFHQELGAEKKTTDIPIYEESAKQYENQIQVIIDEEIPVCSFTFGLPSKATVSLLKEHGITLIGTATTVVEAMEAERIGMDMVVVQGSEAGGHRGNFIHDVNESSIGLMSLIPQVVDHVQIPVIAAGGIMDGRGLIASMSLGAKGVQMGTAFLTTEESGANPVHKNQILNATEDEIVLTKAFSGKWARGIKNNFIVEMEGKEVAPFPVQNTLTQTMRKAASSQKNSDYMSLWSGQSPRLAKQQTVEEIIQQIIQEAIEIKEKL